MTIVHIVSTLKKINYGIWNVVLSNFEYFEKKEVKSFLITPDIQQESLDIIDKSLHPFLVEIDSKDIKNYVISNFDKRNTILVTHGCWTFISKLGSELKNVGYKWVSYPHGMLEPWAMQYKKIKKFLYFNLIEKGRLKYADAVVAVGKPEFDNLNKTRVNNALVHITNGTSIDKYYSKSFGDTINVLFMARLHEKKGVIPLIKAWSKSKLNNQSRFILNIAGPDEGELSQCRFLLDRNKVTNVKILGPVYNDPKFRLLQDAHFFVLPSFSEGFPTSIIEAMSYGVVPLITEGCNFPEAFNAQIAIKITTDIDELSQVLNRIFSMKQSQIEKLSKDVYDFVVNNYSLHIVVDKQFELYSKILNEN